MLTLFGYIFAWGGTIALIAFTIAAIISIAGSNNSKAAIQNAAPWVFGMIGSGILVGIAQWIFS
jgi:hypothetical protein